MESLWSLSGLIAYTLSILVILLSIAAVFWQAIITTGYERRRNETCEEKLKRTEEQLLAKIIEVERLELLLMGAGVRVSGHGTLIVGGDVAGGGKFTGRDNSTTGNDTGPSALVK